MSNCTDKAKARVLLLATARMLVLPLSAPAPARAQQAADNPVASAGDAFGLTLGLESIGMYSPGQVRGFSPETAGNVRIDGLYFDQQGALSNRVVAGSAIRVGITEIGYAFPAPTGIVDYDLRNAGDGTPSATIIATAGPYQAWGLSIDGSVPLIGKKLLLPLGVSYQVSTQTPYANYPGYTSAVISAGATPQWSPNDRVTVRGLFDWQQTRKAATFPLYFTAGDFLPPPITRDYLGQNWALGQSLMKNLGGLISARLNRSWSLAAGLFRSSSDSPVSFADLYTGIRPNGQSEHLVVGYPDQTAASDSGEVRLTGRFRVGDWRHEFILMSRGRHTLARYGGDEVIDLGPVTIGTDVQAPEPNFVYSARTSDRTDLWSVGTAYHVSWRKLAELEIGVQQENYREVVTSPETSSSQVTDHPLRAYGNSALLLTRSVTLYAGYTQGLEDSGVAPSIAANRGAVLPASETWQIDSGLRYAMTPHFTLITGLYELQKPYFNLATNAIDRELGVQRARGFEFSIAGQHLDHFDINAGVLLARVGIVGPNLAAEGVGPIALGQPRLQYTANVDYTVPWWPALSLDLAAIHFGAVPATVDNRVYSPATTTLNLGGRYAFTLLGKCNTVRVQVQNATDSYWWTNVYTPGFFEWGNPRAVWAYLTTDL